MKRLSVKDRLMDKINKTDSCWEWTAFKDPRGYGRLVIDRKPRLAHKVLWEMENGPVPEGLELDHLCKNQGCVRPSHLEAVTHAENMRRYFATYTCKGDHEPEWYIEPKGTRRCRACIREYNRTYVRKNPENDRITRLKRKQRTSI